MCTGVHLTRGGFSTRLFQFQVFEKSLVVKIIKEIGLCPVTNEPLSLDDLIDVQVSSTVPAVKPDAAGSIPQLLAALQSEYDANALEMYSLRKTLHETRQELSETLYQLDAATRVVARVVRERDEYRRLAEEGGGFGGAGSGKNENSQQKKNANAEPAKKKAKTGGGLPEQVRRVASCRVDVVGVGADFYLLREFCCVYDAAWWPRGVCSDPRTARGVFRMPKPRALGTSLACGMRRDLR